MKTKKPWWALVPFYAFTMVFVFFPLIYMLILSFRGRIDLYTLSNEFTWENYQKILDPIYVTAFKQSFKMAFLSTFFVCLIGYPFGYFMARLKKKQKNVVLFLMMIPFWTNSLLRLYGWMIFFRSKGALDQILMHLHFIDMPLRLLYSYPVVIVGMVYMLLPFMILAIYSSVEKMDWTLVEAARDLGASKWKAFWDITFRSTLPGLFAGMILTFVPSMGLFFVSDLLGGNKIVLVGNVIQDQLLRAHNWPFAASMSVILMLMTLAMIYVYKKMFGEKS